ncbi:MAG: Ger(x)C family spore germination protein [Bacillota bacterium]
MPQKVRLISALVLAVLGLTGCWGQREIDEAAYMVAMGLDRGRRNNIVVTVAVGDVAGQGGTQSQTQGAQRWRSRIFSTVAPDVFAALSAINSNLERQINPTHLKMVVFSENLARHGIDKYLDALVRWRQFRRTVYLAVSPGPARDVIRAVQPPTADNPGKFLEMVILTQKFVGYTITGQFLDFYNAYKTKGEAPIAFLIAPKQTGAGANQNREDSGQTVGGPDVAATTGSDLFTKYGDPGKTTAGNTPEYGEAPLQAMGTAVFKKGKMIGKLNGNETMALSMMRGEFQRAFIIIPDPQSLDKKIQIDVSQIKKPAVKMESVGGGLIFKVKLYILSDMAGVQSQRSYELPKRIVEKAIGKWIAAQCRSVIDKAQKNGADIFGFGDRARWLVPDWQAWRAYDYERKFRSAEIQLAIKVHINRTGLVLEKDAVKEE